MFLKNEMRKPSEVLHNPSLPFTTTYLRSAGASAFKSGTGLGRGELQRGRWGDRKQEGPCMSSALLQCEAAYIWLTTKLCSDLFKQKFDGVWQLNSLKICNTLGIFQVCRVEAELPQELLLLTVKKMCFGWYWSHASDERTRNLAMNEQLKHKLNQRKTSF